MKALIVSKALLFASYREKLSELVHLGVEVTAVVPHSWREGGKLQVLEPGAERDYEIVVTDVRFTGRFHVHYYPELPHIIRAERPDLVHLDEEPYNLATYLGARAGCRAGIPSIFFTWQNINRRYPLPFRAMETRVYRSASHAIAGSEEAARVLREKGFRSGITVVPQFGVDPEMFSPRARTHGSFTVGFLNRFVEAKGTAVTIDALAGLPGDVRMTMVGDGPMDGSIREAARIRGLIGRIDIKPRVPSTDVPELLRGLDVVILPSLTTRNWKEQFGRVLIEAMACGVPVIGSDSGEIPNVIGDAGLIVPEGNASALADAIQTIRTDALLRAELAERGRERVLQKFTHAHVAELTKAAYVETVSTWNRR
jgi:glycosyltransferase involved in cell wall biosynthesis